MKMPVSYSPWRHSLDILQSADNRDFDLGNEGRQMAAARMMMERAWQTAVAYFQVNEPRCLPQTRSFFLSALKDAGPARAWTLSLQVLTDMNRCRLQTQPIAWHGASQTCTKAKMWQAAMAVVLQVA